MHAALNLMGLDHATHSDRSYEVKITSVEYGKTFNYAIEVIYLFGNSIKYKNIIYYPSEFEKLLTIITKDKTHGIM